MLLLQQMVVLFLLMLIGFICSKKEIINDEVSKKISAIVVNIANPAMILYGCMGAEVMERKELLFVIAVIICFFCVLLVIAQIIPGLLRVRKKSYGIYRVMTIFSNIGFMGFPVIAVMYGKEALIYGAMFTIPYNLLIYTYGITALTMNKEEAEQPDSGKKRALPFSRLCNIGVLSCVAALIIYFFEIPVPVFLQDTARNLSNLTAPLSMMVIGASLAAIHMKDLFTDIRLIVFAAVKMLVIPIAGTLLIKLAAGDTIFTGVCMIMLATPVGSMTSMLARQYDSDYDVASKGVALTTLLSVVTIPIVAAIIGI